MSTLMNILGFQISWFASVLGAAKGLSWLGPLAVTMWLTLHISMAPNRMAEACLALSAGVLGFLLDTLLIASGVFVPVQYLWPAPFSPLWMVFLWINFATLLNRSLGWLHGRYLLAVLLGTLGGPAAYYSGAELGAIVRFPHDKNLILLAVAWGLAMPVVLWLANDFEKRFGTTPSVTRAGTDISL